MNQKRMAKIKLLGNGSTNFFRFLYFALATHEFQVWREKKCFHNGGRTNGVYIDPIYASIAV